MKWWFSVFYYTLFKIFIQIGNRLVIDLAIFSFRQNDLGDILFVFAKDGSKDSKEKEIEWNILQSFGDITDHTFIIFIVIWMYLRLTVWRVDDQHCTETKNNTATSKCT